MRKLMWIAIGFAAACGLCAYVLPMEWIRYAGFAALVLGGLAAIFGGRKWVPFRVGLVLLGLGLGSCWYGLFYSHYLSPAARLEGQTKNVTVRTTDFSRETDYGISAEGRITLEGKSYRVRLWLDRKEPLAPGACITGPFRFAMTAPREDPVSFHSGNGVFLLAFQEDAVDINPDSDMLWLDRIAHLRQWIREAIHACFPEKEESFARALLLGDTSLLDYETDVQFKVSGIRHVVAVSGLHVSILISLLGAVTFRRKYLMVPVGLAGLTFFAALAGFTPSVTRGCIMGALLLLAMLFSREYDGATALSFAVIVMLLVNPLTVASVSFQLSVASVAGIFLVSSRLRLWIADRFPPPGASQWKWWVIRCFSISVSTTLGAMLFTTPLCAWYFGMVSLVGVVTNLLALWLISGIFYGIMAMCLIYALWAPGAAILGWIVAWPIRYVLAVARFMASLPLAAVYMDSAFTVAWLVFVYVLLLVFLERERQEWKRLLCCGVLGLCIALLASWWEPKGTCITVLDVGQGQCILLQSDGRNFLVDCGGDSDSRAADTAANHLLSRGIRRLDALILTHPDRDHAGGVENFLTQIEAKVLIHPPEASAIAGENILCAHRELKLEAGNTVIRVFPPTYPGTGNEKSLCVLFESEKCAILITGDRSGFGERMLLRSADIPEVDILVAGHHGAGNSTCDELLEAVSPEIVCISAGRDNPYGHPAPQLLKRLQTFGCTVYRTDLHGSITIRR